MICRPSFILGGGGTGFAADPTELEVVAANGLAASPVGEILLEQSIAGWKEYELEVMRDGADNAVVVCSIENLDPMGTHTGDSITVAPAQTLTDVEYQVMRDAAFACIRRIGVETGGSNIQFAVNPADGEMVVIEMNPRVSRSSALASKATGFPIAKIAAKLAVGYRLDEVMNDITGETPACFEPTIDYVVVKIPRFAFEKFSGVPPVLGTKMQSVGEVMALGRTFTESVQKACRSLETGRLGLNGDPAEAAYDGLDDDELVRRAAVATPDRIFHLEAALRRGMSIERLHEASGVDPWFLDQIASLVEERAWLVSEAPAARPRCPGRTGAGSSGPGSPMPSWPGCGALPKTEVRECRKAAGVTVTYKTVDTCAAEFAARTPYHYSTWEDEDEVAPLRPAGGRHPRQRAQPHRAGHRVRLLLRPRRLRALAPPASRRSWSTATPKRCRPTTTRPTASSSNRSPPEDVLHVCEADGRQPPGRDRQPRRTDAAQAGPRPASAAGVPVLGTSPDSIDLAEDRERFNAVCEGLGIPQPPGGTATDVEAAVAVATRVEYPVLVRPSYVLGGRAMEIVYDEAGLRAAMAALAASAEGGPKSGAAGCRPPGPSSSTASWRTPPRSTSTPCATGAAKSSSAGSWSTSRRPACTPATPPAPFRRPPCPATSSP